MELRHVAGYNLNIFIFHIPKTKELEEMELRHVAGDNLNLFIFYIPKTKELEEEMKLRHVAGYNYTVTGISLRLKRYTKL